MTKRCDLCAGSGEETNSTGLPVNCRKCYGWGNICACGRPLDQDYQCDHQGEFVGGDLKPLPGPSEKDWNFTSPEGWDFDKGETCPSCNGQMVDPNFPSRWCTTCDGTGMVGPHLSSIANRTRKH